MSSNKDKDKEKVGVELLNDNHHHFSNSLIYNNRDHLHHHHATTTTSSSRQWSSSGFKNPRIVRVSRTFGGKDRHSKVCTIRGLRDRRIRLSVPTAIQLYDLQDRLGLSQPSKVIDWLMDATKLDIDKLPPLQFPPGCFAQFHRNAGLMGGGELTTAGFLSSPSLPPPHFTSFLDANLTLMKDSNMSGVMLAKEGININDEVDDHEDDDQEEEDDDDEQSMESKFQESIKWNGTHSTAAAVAANQYHYQLIRSGNNNSTITNTGQAQSLFPITGTSATTGGGGGGGFFPAAGGLMLNNSIVPYTSTNNNFYQYWGDPSSLSLSQFHHHQLPSSSTTSSSLAHDQTPQYYTNNNTTAYHHPTSSNTHQLFFCPPPVTVTTTTSFFPSHASYTSTNNSNEIRQELNTSRFNHDLPSSSLTAPSPYHSTTHNNANQSASDHKTGSHI